MSLYKIGERVMALEEITYERSEEHAPIAKGLCGTVVEIINGLVGVSFDKCIDGHDCDGKGTDSHCWRVPSGTIGKAIEGADDIVNSVIDEVYAL